MKEIVLDIFDDGEVRIETKGFKGKTCLKEAQFLKDLLGKQTFQQLTPAYYVNQKKETKKYLNLCG
jgi:hypothetical protein